MYLNFTELEISKLEKYVSVNLAKYENEYDKEKFEESRANRDD